MNHTYRRYHPKEIFISFMGREATEEERWRGARSGIIHHLPTGIEVLDLFANMVRHYMKHTTAFYAARLGVTPTELSGGIKLLTGLTCSEWIENYLWLSISDLLLHTDWPLTRIAQETGYNSLKTFSDVFVKQHGMSPSLWRRKYGAIKPKRK